MTTARKKLILLGTLASLAGALAAAGARCWDDVEGKEFRLDYPVPYEGTRALIGRPSPGKSWQSIDFAEPLRFKRVGETIEVFGYGALTLADFGEAHTGKYAMRATLRKAYTGGPVGFMTEYVVKTKDVRLVERLVAPVGRPGTRGILPGQLVIRTIGEGELQRLDDRYLIELPAKVTVSIMFGPSPDEYDFKLAVAKDGKALPLRRDRYGGELETMTAGVYELRIEPAEDPVPREPDRYWFYVVWGDASIGVGRLPGQEIHWKQVPEVSTSSGR